MRSRPAHKLYATRLGALALVLVSALAVPPSAHSLPPAKTVGRGTGAISKGATSVLGVVWNVDNTPMPDARVQLRNLLTAKIHGTAVTNEVGQFTFTQIEAGRYVVELLGANGRVSTVGHAFVIAPGETVATFVRMGTKVPWFVGFFGNATSAVASTAGSLGLTATAASQGITVLSPVQHCDSPCSAPK